MASIEPIGINFTTGQAKNVGSGDALYISGKLGVGTSAPAFKVEIKDTTATTTTGTEALSQTQYTVAPSNNHSAGAKRQAFSAYIDVPAANTKSIQTLEALAGYCENYGTGNLDVMNATVNWAYNATNVTVASLLGSWHGVESDLGTVTRMVSATFEGYAYGGTITHMTGLEVGNLEIAGATVTNRYALKANAPVGTATNDYGVWVDGSSRINYFAGKVGVGTASPATSAAVDITSTTQALLLSRMDTTQRDALTAVNGMVIYNSQTNKFQGYENGAWANLI
jgi:hypothetical protein